MTSKKSNNSNSSSNSTKPAQPKAKTQSKPAQPKPVPSVGIVFWHEASGTRPVAQLAQTFTQYGEEAPEAVGVRWVFTHLEKVFDRSAASRIFLRRAAADVQKGQRREMLDVLQVKPEAMAQFGRDYEVLGQLALNVVHGKQGGYVLSVICEHGETELVRDDQDLNAVAGCGCTVWQYVPKLLQEWFIWRGDNATLDGSHRAAEYRKLYAKYGAISLAEHGRPFYFPSDQFVPWEIVEACGDRVYRLPLTPEAKADLADVTYRVFFDELQAMEQEVEAWDATVRGGTKQRRLESLMDLRKQVTLYEAVLGEATRALGELVDALATKIEETVLGPQVEDEQSADETPANEEA